MSEIEKKRRAEYKRKRKNWIVFQTVIAIILAVVMISSFITYQVMNQTYYIEYTEDSSVDYKVYLKENDFYDEEFLGKDQSYIASLIESVKADFVYKINMEAQGVDYDYTYSVDSELRITDRFSNATIFSQIEKIKPEQKLSENSNNKLVISESVDVDYGKYNELANKFVETYKLTNASSNLILTMHVNVLSACEEFENDAKNEYVVSLNIPLVSNTLEIMMTSTVPSSESKIVACERGIYKDTSLNISIATGILELICLIILIIFIYATRNTDINYAIKVKRLVSAYRSYIQKINNEFDREGYQVLLVDTFSEMLEIRDTIQSPVLMSENEDKTRTEFIIPTNTKILYMYEIKVDDYDLIYNTEEPTVEVVEEDNGEELVEPVEVTVEEPVAEEPVTEEEPEPVVEEPVAEEEPEPVTEEPVAEEPAPEIVEEPLPEVETVVEIIEKEPELIVVEAPRVEFIEEPAPEVVEEPVAEEEPEPVVEEPVAEEEPVPEVVEEPAPEVVEEPVAVVVDTVEEVIEEEVAETVTAEMIESLIESGADTDSLRIVDGKIVSVRFRTSYMSRLIQSEPELQDYYTAVKNKLLSYKGVKARTSFTFESFNKGRIQCAKLNVKGTSLLVYIGLNPYEYDMEKYRLIDSGDKPKLDKVPMLIKVKSKKSLSTALYFIEEVMNKNGIPFAKEQNEDYHMPFETDEELVDRGLIKVILPGGVEIDEHTRIEKLDIGALLSTKRRTHETVVVENADKAPEVYEIDFVAEEDVDEELILAAVAEPDVTLSEIEYEDVPDEVYEEIAGHPGVEIVGVVWPERAHRNKIYRYDPNGHTIHDGDTVLVPTRDAHQNREVIRKATVAHGNHMIDPEALSHPLKKVIAIVTKKSTEDSVK